MPDRSQLLTTREMAMFVARGFLRFDELVPAELNEHFIAAYAENPERAETGLPAIPAGTSADEAWPEHSPLAEIFALPRLAGIVESLVGPGCLFDHHFLHIRAADRIPSHVVPDSSVRVPSPPNADGQIKPGHIQATGGEREVLAANVKTHI